MIELEADEYDRLAPLFRLFMHDLAPQAVLSGVTPGRVFADRLRSPTMGLLWTGHRLYLVSPTMDEELEERLGQFLTTVILPEAQAAGLPALMLNYGPSSLAKRLDGVLGERMPVRRRRQYYMTYLPAEWQPFDWRAIMLPEFRLLSVNAPLLARDELTHHDRLVKEVLAEGPSVKHYLETRFGVCIVHGDVLAGWCLSEFNAGHRCEIGIETVSAYQRQGLATAMTAALMEMAHSRGLVEIGWHCFADNDASVRTARRAGLRLFLEYPVYFGWFDQKINLAVMGNLRFRDALFEEALDWYQRALRHEDLPTWVYWNAACAGAELGRYGVALAYLNEAVDRGFSDIERLRTSKHLQGVRGTLGWYALIDRVIRGG
ncbi:MAG: GNAT family N-acetyltransferase [Candidatus Promineifilaceae bacterium]|nr:GNAT family N-acetyltransferase [Candidatus Promineifilaceae bacterium]